MADQGQLQELDATIAGQHLKLTGSNLNTLFTILGFLVSCLIAYVLWSHTGETKEASTALVSALKEQTQVVRESNCLQTYRGPDEQKSNFCKQVSR